MSFLRAEKDKLENR